ncbi:MAG: tRNA pseudouridine(55) synthase TruB [Polaribacter sp.]|nr:tRNA pseudouridine(55) synthase TruB [Polaribacter sp.]
MIADDFLNGQVLLIDKPLEWTSFQAVNKIRWHIKKRFGLKKIKVGHAGTLDPLATGLLIICTGKKTKEIQTFQAQNKEYTGTFFIGATTPSYDLETKVDSIFEINHINKELLIDITNQFKGEILQKPPIFSAIKKDGKRLYDIARKGESTEIEARKITIQNFEITSFDLPEINFKIACSKGTYIRSIANDYGKALQSGAYLSSLRRTKIGNFSVENALSIEEFIDNL